MTSSSVICIFPGQASQFVGMGKDLAQQFKEFELTLQEASDVLGFDMTRLMFDDPESQLNLTEFTQPAVLAMSTGIVRVLRERAGLVPNLVAGHSLGEYSALVALGALPFDLAVKAVRFRGQAMQKAVPVGVGAMVAYLGSKVDDVTRLCTEETRPDGRVEVVNFNSPSQMVLSGHKEAVMRVAGLIKEKALGKALPLPVSAPFHSSLMLPAADAMREYFASVALQPFAGRIVANVDAQLHARDDYSIEKHLVPQIASAVLWTQTLTTLREAGDDSTLWLEVGPGSVLQGLLRKTVVGCEVLTTSEYQSLAGTLARLG